ncbi:MAG: filamentous hemagglutinin N-terminal domain-containing protein [Leptolyngbyaceae cyanobacterium bins.302]|nr:filamentous hemagglutinin N-terminal domain-containing protein [Leptolyngbyaceae cyanobacterium bins.302]
MHSSPFKQWTLRISILLMLGLLNPGSHQAASAQIIPDQTLAVGERSRVSGSPVLQINGGAVRGSNLFHSFSQFSVSTGQTAFFNNSATITNIISRVTGNTASTIDGTLRANGSANLFFINPNGIIFGADARLNLGGSFIATTASAIQFGNQGNFSATAPQAPGLLTVNPSALLFNQSAIGRIENRSIARAGANPAGGRLSGLQVSDGASLLLVGGDILLDGGGLNALGGQVELLAIAGNGSLGLTRANNLWQLNVPPSLALGNIQLINQARINTSGARGGFVGLQGNQITLANQSEVLADTYGNLDGLGIAIRATQFRVQDGSEVSASAIEGSQGNSGGIRVDAQDLIAIVGTGPGSRNSGGSGGNSGGSGSGGRNNGGNNEGSPSKLASDARGGGSAGNLIINTRRLEVRDGGKISSSNIDRPGGGNIFIQASDSIDLIGTSSQRQRASGISVQTRGSGRAGDIFLTTGRLRILDGAELSASTLGSGAGGNISVTVQDTLEVAGTSRDGLLISRLDAETGRPRNTLDAGQLVGSGPGGSIRVSTDRLIVRDSAEISVSGISPLSNSGNAGNLEIDARVIELDRGGSIAAITTSGNGGDITLNVGELLLLRRGSFISATAGTAQAGGDGGNITINAPNAFIVGVLSENSDIRANAFAGRGGNVNITAQGVFGIQFQLQDTPFSDITASSQFGLDGVVSINTPNVDPSAGLVPLPVNLVDSSRQISQACSSGTSAIARVNRFVVTGRGGLPTSPDSSMAIDHPLVDLVSLVPTGATQAQISADKKFRQEPGKIVEAQTWVKRQDGEIYLIAQTETTGAKEFGLTPALCQGMLNDTGVPSN